MNSMKHSGVCLWNLSGYNQRPRTFFNFLREFRPQIVLLTELHLHRNQKLDFLNYNVIQKNRSETSASWGGVAILVSHKFKFKVEPILDLETDLEMVAVKVLRPGQHDLIIATLYLPPRKTKPYKYNLMQLKPILRNWLESKNDIIIGGDYNARHTIFGDKESKKNGKNFVQLLDELEITALIPNTPTRPKSGTFLDFYLTNNPKLLHSPITYEPNPYRTETKSDHNMVLSKLQLN